MKLARPTGKRSDDEIRTAIQAFIDGDRTEVIAKRHNVTQPTISYWLHKHGKRLFGDELKMRDPGRPPLTEPSSRDKTILKLHGEGHSMQNIGDQFGITRSRISSIVNTWKSRGF